MTVPMTIIFATFNASQVTMNQIMPKITRFTMYYSLNLALHYAQLAAIAERCSTIMSVAFRLAEISPRHQGSYVLGVYVRMWFSAPRLPPLLKYEKPDSKNCRFNRILSNVERISQSNFQENPGRKKTGKEKINVGHIFHDSPL